MGRAFDSVTVVALCTLLSTLSTSAHAQSTAAASNPAPTDATDSSTAPTSPHHATAPAAAPSRSGPPPIQVEQVTVPGTRILAGRATTEVDATFDVVATLLADLSRYREFLPQVRETRVIHRRRGVIELYVQVQLLRNLGILWAVSRFSVVRTASALVIDGHMVQGNVSRFDLHVDARPVAGTAHTRVTVQMLGVPTFFFPDSLVAQQQTRWTGRTLSTMRDRAESVAASLRPSLNAHASANSSGGVASPTH